MAKRKKRKHRVSAKYVAFKQKKPKSIIPPTLSTKTLTRETKTDFKAVRNTIRRLYSEQLKTTPIAPTPKEYKPTRKKNRREARQKRKEKKQKRKEQIEQKQKPKIEAQQTQQEQDVFINEDEDILELDDANVYLEMIESEILYVEEQLFDEWKKQEQVLVRFSYGFERILFWLSDAKDLPYETKEDLVRRMSQDKYLEEIHQVLGMRHYEEIIEAIDGIADSLQSIIESFL